MFVHFFYFLREVGIPVSPTSFLRLQQALAMGLVNSLDDFYIAARTSWSKANGISISTIKPLPTISGAWNLRKPRSSSLSDMARSLLEEWLKDPQDLADALGIDEEELKKLTPGGTAPIFSGPA